MQLASKERATASRLAAANDHLRGLRCVLAAADRFAERRRRAKGMQPPSLRIEIADTAA